MAFLVEDGTIVAGATSYASVATAKAYWDDEGFDYTSFSPDTKIQRALVKATRYISFRFTFKGTIASTTQSLAWPRCYVYNKEGVLIPSDSVPPELQQATIEYARRALTTELSPDVVVDETGQQIKRKLDKIGPIEDETVYFEGQQSRLQEFPSADYLIKDLIKGQSGQIVVN